MLQIDVQLVQRDLPRVLEWVAGGAVVLVSRDGRPVAEIRPARVTPDTHVQPLGLGHGQAELPPNAFDPLPDDLLDAFEGKPE